MIALTIPVTTSCNQNCGFCVRGESLGVDLPFETLMDNIVTGRKNGAEFLLLTGGEPTIRPDLLILVEKSVQLGYRILQVQTNGYLLSDLLPGLIKATEGIKLQISLSLHGDRAGIHDSLTNTVGSFEKAVLSMHSLSRANLIYFINVVLATENISSINGLAEMALKWGATGIQFALPHLDPKSDFLKTLPSLDKIVASIVATCKYYPVGFVRTEGFTFCMMRGCEEAVGELYWPRDVTTISPSAIPYNYSRDLLPQYRQKPEFCKECYFNNDCFGVWKEYIPNFLNLNPSPIKLPDHLH